MAWTCAPSLNESFGGGSGSCCRTCSCSAARSRRTSRSAATTSIDTETEALIQRGIHVLMEGKTSLVIAHRLSTIQDVDRIFVMHHGRVVEAGSHAQLLARGGLYARLYQLQYAYAEPRVAAAGA